MNLKVENGTFAYKNGRNIVENLNLSVESGDFLAILGPNGAGKTTMLRCIMGFIPWKSGQSKLDDEDIRKIPPNILWKKIAYVPQSKGVVSSCTVEEMVLLGRSSRMNFLSVPKEEDIQKVMEIMEKLKISKLRERRCFELSGGELQMVLIAKALAAEPRILILDEPESNLDFRNQLLVLKTLSGLVQEGLTCIFNTHYPAHALQRANKSLILRGDGTSIFGNTKDIVTEDNIAKAFGVKAIIENVESDIKDISSVVPLSIIKEDSLAQVERTKRDFSRRIAVVTIIANDYEMAERINESLHDYSEYVIGRMGMPYRDCGVNIINITLDAPKYAIAELVEKLSLLNEVSVKATYADGEF